MEYRILKQTDLKVSRLCLGTMTFGKPVEQDEANRMVDLCLDMDINFVDTANMYQLGCAETMLGHALKGRRDRVVLASKVRAKMGDDPDQSGLSKKAIFRAIEESLRRLQTDYLDLYFLHQPDYDVAIEETLEALEELVQQGKIRYPATSNYASWQVVQILGLQRLEGYTPAATSQPMYNLLSRGIEQEFLPMAKAFDVSILAYNPLAAGLLTGKHRESAITQGGRFDGNPMYQERYWHARIFEAIEQLKTLAERSGRSLISLAFAWLLHNTATDVVILGASNLEQLKQNIEASQEEPLADNIVHECNEVWRNLRGPIPMYNR
ncbi:MAG TPA: aldo/keto reductase [Acidobacteriaceae bacterium]|jgi:aryl-alcohol dehydrogenase-like predicted oxidoreductase|nr:aldo/keto reductase [Acidobacteriaceae bacterium]